MKFTPKKNAIVGISLTVLTLLAYISGKLAENNEAWAAPHNIISIVALVPFILHILGYWKIIKNYPKILKGKMDIKNIDQSTEQKMEQNAQPDQFKPKNTLACTP